MAAAAEGMRKAPLTCMARQSIRANRCSHTPRPDNAGLVSRWRSKGRGCARHMLTPPLCTCIPLNGPAYPRCILHCRCCLASARTAAGCWGCSTVRPLFCLQLTQDPHRPASRRRGCCRCGHPRFAPRLRGYWSSAQAARVKGVAVRVREAAVRAARSGSRRCYTFRLAYAASLCTAAWLGSSSRSMPHSALRSHPCRRTLPGTHQATSHRNASRSVNPVPSWRRQSAARTAPRWLHRNPLAQDV